MRGRTMAVAVMAASMAMGASFTFRDAEAQYFDPRRPSTFIVGAPGGPSPMQRVDARRSGVAKDDLPSGPLRVAWRKNIGQSIEQSALVGEGNKVAIVTGRGEVTFLSSDGEEVARANGTGSSAGPAVMTANGTVVFMTNAGEAIGVSAASAKPKFVTRIGGELNVRAAPLALDDGGAVVATMTDLVVLDASGAIRSRVTLPEAPSAPLVASPAKILAITGTGTVYGFFPGSEPVRLGTFGAAVNGGAALSGANTLIAIIEDNHLVELNLTTGMRTTRSMASSSVYLGPPCVQKDGQTTILAVTQTHVRASTFDTSGREIAHPVIGAQSATTLPDGGITPLTVPPHVGPLVDERGVVAFAAPDGRVGIASDGSVRTVDEVLCSRGGRSAGIAGLTPFGKSSFLVTCEDGVVARITGNDVRR